MSSLNASRRDGLPVSAVIGAAAPRWCAPPRRTCRYAAGRTGRSRSRTGPTSLPLAAMRAATRGRLVERPGLRQRHPPRLRNVSDIGRKLEMGVARVNRHRRRPATDSLTPPTQRIARAAAPAAYAGMPCGDAPRPPRSSCRDAPAVVAGHGRAALLTGDGELLLLAAAEAAAALRPDDAAAAGACAGHAAPARPAPLPVPRPAGAVRLRAAGPAGAAHARAAWRWRSTCRRRPRSRTRPALLPDIADALLRAPGAGRRQPAAQPRRRRAGRLDGRAPAGPGRAPVLAALGQPAARPVHRRRCASGCACRNGRSEAPPPPPGSRPVAPRRGPHPAGRACSGPTPSSGPARPTTPAPPPPPSPRAQPAATRPSCWPRPAPAPARRSATSRPPASGPSATAAASGSAPSPATCSARSTPSWPGCIPDPAERRRRVVVRKGRENYLCLLNLQEQVGAAARRPSADRRSAWSRAGRWPPPMATSPGGDLPGWFAELFGPAPAARASPTAAASASTAPARTTEAASSSTRSAAPARAELVVANHALVMAQARLGRARRQQRADPLRVRRGPPRVRRRRQRLRRRAVRRRGRRAAPLAARRRGRPLPRARACGRRLERPGRRHVPS